MKSPTRNFELKLSLYFLQGPYVYIMDEGYGTEGYVNYPQAISNVFPGLPPNVDAATVWTGNNKLYFFKGNAVFDFRYSWIMYRYTVL